ncbi:MAG: uroporphyrinogen-III C-methyltransferase, partial [Ottowia sp.]|nr:uroporphyrinogen-III C-methyltransferase [Ottowia sp.]
MTPEADPSTPPPALPSAPAAVGAAAPALAPPPAEPPAARSAPAAELPRSALQPAQVAGWMVAIVALTIAVLLWQKVNGMQEVLARQNADAGSQSVEARALARQADDAVRDTAAKLAALDARVADMAAYRAQLEELAQTASRARDENLAVDLEAALRLAQDQSQLTGSTEPLLAALRTADRRLARSQDPRLLPAARAVARDLERVKTATVTDTAGLLGRIDQLLRQVDDLPVANEVGRPSG